MKVENKPIDSIKPYENNPRDKAYRILDLCEDGCLDPIDVLRNVFNYMSADDADDFAESEYPELFDED